MPNNDQKLRDALLRIAEIANQTANDLSPADSNGSGSHRHAGGAEAPSCSVRSLPQRVRIDAAHTATRINPMNAPVIGARHRAGHRR